MLSGQPVGAPADGHRGAREHSQGWGQGRGRARGGPRGRILLGAAPWGSGEPRASPSGSRGAATSLRVCPALRGRAGELRRSLPGRAAPRAGPPPSPLPGPAAPLLTCLPGSGTQRRPRTRRPQAALCHRGGVACPFKSGSSSRPQRAGAKVRPRPLPAAPPSACHVGDCEPASGAQGSGLRVPGLRSARESGGSGKAGVPGRGGPGAARACEDSPVC